MSPALSARLPRVALIGVTGYGGIYLQLVREALEKKAINLVAAVIINRDQAQETVDELSAGGTTIYSSFDEFLAHQSGKIDLCLIPVGIQWHARLTISALQAGYERPGRKAARRLPRRCRRHPPRRDRVQALGRRRLPGSLRLGGSLA